MDNRVFARQSASNPQAIAAAVEQLFQSLPAAGRLSPESRVLVKPNLLSRHAPSKAVTTHPDVLRAVIWALQSRGVRHITVADSPGGPYSPAAMRGIYATCEITAVCEETGVSLYTDCNSAPRASNGRLVREFTLIEPVHSCDFIVNVPKLKTHVLTGLSGAVKNLFGCVPGLLKAEFHMQFPEREQFCQMLVDLCETVQADIHIVDGIIAMEGDGPAGGLARPVGLLLAGENPYQVDLALCHYMGFAPMDAPVLAAAHRCGLCDDHLTRSCLVGGEEALHPLANFAHPRSYEGKLNFGERVPRFLQPLFNRATERVAPRPVILRRNCIGCRKCAEICPEKVIEMQRGKAFIHRKNCIRCFCCHEICPVKAIDIKRNPLFRF